MVFWSFFSEPPQSSYFICSSVSLILHVRFQLCFQHVKNQSSVEFKVKKCGHFPESDSKTLLKKTIINVNEDLSMKCVVRVAEHNEDTFNSVQ